MQKSWGHCSTHRNQNLQLEFHFGACSLVKPMPKFPKSWSNHHRIYHTSCSWTLFCVFLKKCLLLATWTYKTKESTTSIWCLCRYLKIGRKCQCINLMSYRKLTIGSVNTKQWKSGYLFITLVAYIWLIALGRIPWLRMIVISANM